MPGTADPVWWTTVRKWLSTPSASGAPRSATSQTAALRPFARSASVYAFVPVAFAPSSDTTRTSARGRCATV